MIEPINFVGAVRRRMAPLVVLAVIVGGRWPWLLPVAPRQAIAKRILKWQTTPRSVRTAQRSHLGTRLGRGRSVYWSNSFYGQSLAVVSRVGQSG